MLGESLDARIAWFQEDQFELYFGWVGRGTDADGEHNDRTPTTRGAAPRNMAILTIDLADARTNKPVWRTQAAIDSVSPTEKGDEKQVEHAVERMLKKPAEVKGGRGGVPGSAGIG